MRPKTYRERRDTIEEILTTFYDEGMEEEDIGLLSELILSAIGFGEDKVSDIK